MLQIQENFLITNLNTFGIAARAKYFIEVSHEKDLTEIFTDPAWKEIPKMILGGGSNMLFVRDFDGLVIRMNIRGIEHRINRDEIIVEAGAGEVWNELVNYCVDHGFAGMENLSLIPGSVGASPIQNIGAYGVELKDIFYSCKAFEIETGEFKIFTKTDCHFGYRESVFKSALKNKYVIVSVKYRLSNSPILNLQYGAIQQELQRGNITAPTIKDVSQTVSRIRVSKLPDPATIGNAGSFFKNPVINEKNFKRISSQFPEIVNYPSPTGIKLAAGWLIEQCGWKGKTVGNTGTWKNQALVLVNHGGASGSEIFDLSSQIIDSVYSKFGVLLEREVNIIK